MKPIAACIPAVGLVLITLAMQPAQAQQRCTKPYLTRVESVACQLGKEDVASLRRFVWRTRMIHQLHMPDFMPPQPPSTAIARTDDPRVGKDERHDVATAPR
jgi:hypothetical protein